MERPDESKKDEQKELNSKELLQIYLNYYRDNQAKVESEKYRASQQLKGTNYVSIFEYSDDYIPRTAMDILEGKRDIKEVEAQFTSLGYLKGYEMVQIYLQLYNQASRGRKLHPEIAELINEQKSKKYLPYFSWKNLAALAQYGKTPYSGPTWETIRDTIMAEVKHRTRVETEGEKLDIGVELEKRLAQDNAIFTTRHDTLGASALVATNEQTTTKFFEDIRNQHEPNGHVIGIGLGAIFSMLEAFPKDRSPKSLISLDINPEVIAYGKMLLLAIKENPDYRSFNLNFMKNFGGLVYYYKRMLSQQTEDMQRFLNGQTLNFLSDSVDLPSYSDYLPYSQDWRNAQDPFHGGSSRFEAEVFFARHYSLLQKMTLEGNFAVISADITNPKLWEHIVALHGFANSKNLIYVSNAIDHIAHASPTGNLKDAINNGIEIYNRGIRPLANFQNNIVSVDTLRKSRYLLRSHQGMPHYKPSDIYH